MSFTNFLLTANANNETALLEARNYFQLGRINKNDLANHDATFDVETIMDATLALEITAELRKTVRVFRKIINGLLDDPSVGDPVTQAALTGLVAVDDEVCGYTQTMRDHLEGLSKTYPWANKTLQDVMIIRNNVPQTTVEESENFVTINVMSDCELHNPRLMATNPRTNKTVRINNFRGVEKAGLYDCVVPRENRDWVLSVDDFYGVIEAV